MCININKICVYSKQNYIFVIGKYVRISETLLCWYLKLLNSEDILRLNFEKLCVWKMRKTVRQCYRPYVYEIK